MKQKTPQLEDLLSMLGQTQDMMEELRQQNSSEHTTGTITTANDTKLDYIGTPGDTYKRLEDYMVSITELVEQAKLYVTNNPDLENGYSNVATLVNAVTDIFKEFTVYYKNQQKFQIAANMEMIKHENKMKLERQKHEWRMEEIRLAKSEGEYIEEYQDETDFNTLNAAADVEIQSKVNLEDIDNQ